MIMDSRIPRIVCMTSDGYIDAVRPFIWLFKKYWGFTGGRADVLVAGFTEPDFDLNDFGGNVNVNVDFHSIGKFEEYPIAKWSDSLLALLDQIDDEHIILMLEDYWVIRSINTEAIVGAKQFMEQYPNTLKFDLAADRFFAGGAKRDHLYHGWLDIVLSDPESAYHMSLMTGMWNTELLKKVLLPDWNPWDVEIKGTTHLRNFPDLQVVGSGQWPVKHTLAFRGGEFGKVLLDELQMPDIYSLKQLGFLQKWGM